MTEMAPVAPGLQCKRPGAAKAWVFTWNNPPDDWKQQLQDAKDHWQSWSWGEETAPTTGTFHIQGYVETRNKSRWTQFGLPKTIHWEPARGSRKRNQEYTQKGENIDASSDMKKIRVLEQLDPWMEEILAICESEPDFRSIYWIWEPKGKCGKSAFAKYLCYKKQAMICDGSPADMKHQIASSKIKPGIVIFDVPRSKFQHGVAYQGLEQIKNGCFASSKYESSMVLFDSPHVLVFANEPPEQHQMSADRWKIAQLHEGRLHWETN